MAKLPSGYELVPVTRQTKLPPGFEIVNEGPPLPSVAQDIAQSAPSMFGRAALAVPGMIGNAMGGGMLIGRKINQLLGYPVETPAEVWMRNPLEGISSTGLERKWEQATGTPFANPKTEAGKTVQRIVEPTVGAALMGGGNPITAAARYGAIPAVAGETVSRGAETLGFPEEYQDAARLGTEIVTAGGMSLTKPRDISPTIAGIEKQVQNDFLQVERAGVTVSPTALQRLANNARLKAQSRLTDIPEIDRPLSPDTLVMLKGIDAMAARGAVPLTTVHKYRQLIDSELAKSDIRKSDRAVLIGVKRQIDAFFENPRPGDIIGGGPEIGQVLSRAIKGYAREQRAKTVQEIIDLAETRVNSKTGFSRDDALRAEFKTFIRNKDAMHGFNRAERRAFQEIALGAPIARALSGLAPTNNVGNLLRLAGFGGGAFYMNQPAAAAALPIAGTFGKAYSAAATRRNVARADQLVRGGAGSVPRGPMLAPLSLLYATGNITPPTDVVKDKNGIPILGPDGRYIPAR